MREKPNFLDITALQRHFNNVYKKAICKIKKKKIMSFATAL